MAKSTPAPRPSVTNGAQLAPHSYLTSHEAAVLLQVNPTSINNWANSDLLKTFRTPGGHRRIQAQALASFVQSQGIPMPKALAQAAAQRVLWVDSHSAAEKGLAKKFDRADVEFRFVDSAALALIAVGAFAPDVVVLDGRADDIDRLTIVKALAANAATQKTRVAYVDGAITPAEQSEGEAAGVGLFLTRGKDPLAVLS